MNMRVPMRRSALLFLVLTFSITAFAQGGNTVSTIQVRVLTDGERPITERARVQLLSSTGAEVAESFSIDGMAQFEGIRNGSYKLRVTGINFEDTTTPTFDVLPQETTSMHYVHVKIKSSAAAGNAAGPATVSSADLAVPPKAQKEFKEGSEALQHSDWKSAAAHFDKAILIYPQYASAYNNRGVVAMKSNDVVTAKASFQKAIDLHENSGSAFLNMGRLYLLERNFDETARYMNKSLELSPNNPEALTILADCDIAIGRYAEAVDIARRVHSGPHERFAVAHVIAAAALEKQNDAKGAIAEYQQFLKEDPNSPRAAGARKALERLVGQPATAN